MALKCLGALILICALSVSAVPGLMSLCTFIKWVAAWVVPFVENVLTKWRGTQRWSHRQRPLETIVPCGHTHDDTWTSTSDSFSDVVGVVGVVEAVRIGGMLESRTNEWMGAFIRKVRVNFKDLTWSLSCLRLRRHLHFRKWSSMKGSYPKMVFNWKFHKLLAF